MEADPEELNDLAGGADYAEILSDFEAKLREIVDPEAVDKRAKADQAALIDRHGGREAVLSHGHSFTPPPLPATTPTTNIRGPS